MFNKILIANRGEIACRIIRTLKKMGIASVAVYSEADMQSKHVLEADEAFLIGPASPSQSYLSIDAILKAALESGAQAIHPGYGFLSENVEFARACENSGIVFIGPDIEHIEAFALKHVARKIALDCGVPLLPGSGLLADCQAALVSAAEIGYPVMLKSSAGGGGIGMKICFTPQEIEGVFESVVRLSSNSFGDGSVYLEKFIPRAKHLEVQIFGDGEGEILILGARDCSAQRRHQKVIEETPVPGLDPQIQAQLFASARLLGQAVKYRSAGTVEFLFDVDSNAFYFLEVNTRLQVEHGVTEQVTGLDIVEMMIQEAARELPPLESIHITPGGASIEVRIYAEDPFKNFLPAPGELSAVRFPPPELARTETWVESGVEITPYYDPLIAKIIVTGVDRPDAVGKMQGALDACTLSGTETNLRYLQAVVADSTFVSGEMITSTLSQFNFVRHAFEVLEGGTQTTIQDFPGRQGYWHVGVPPSGPMDSLSSRLANRLVGNSEDAPTLEMTGIGARMRFDADAQIAICGADMNATLNGVRAPMWQTVAIGAGDKLEFSSVLGAGNRTYLAVRGGIVSPPYLGSASTFMLGHFGGHAGRALRAGDIIHYRSMPASASPAILPTRSIPRLNTHWEVAVLYGPHGAPEFFTEGDIEAIFAAEWRVHYQSDRTGIRLIGPKPEWARKDGGEAGLHPSNIHDNAYAVGSVDFTGDMPILLGPDGPSLGGFVCPAVVVSAELWKLGQLKAGDTVQFRRITESQARELEDGIDNLITTLNGPVPTIPAATEYESAILKVRSDRTPVATFRADGDKYLLIEFGERVLDLALRIRVHLLEERLNGLTLPGIIDITPGVRSLQIHYDNRKLPRIQLLETLEEIERDLTYDSDVTLPSRIVHMPLSWNDPATQLAQSKYMRSVRPDAPWCPDNIEFIRRINGLTSVEDVYQILHSASYLVLGLGDVYLGAPVATPIDPRHRLVTTKYNPARTWTPENAVGIGGAYMCVYGMEGPGGYQLVGRTVPVWNTHRSTKTFVPGSPWALRYFDQIRFYPVSSEDLLTLRRDISNGSFELRIEEASFRFHQYRSFLTSIEAEASAFREIQQRAFREERDRWARNGLLEHDVAVESPEPEEDDGGVEEGRIPITSPMTANVFQVAVDVGQRISAGAKLVVLDAMKTEIVVSSSTAGVVEEIRCVPGKMARAGQILAVICPD